MFDHTIHVAANWAEYVEPGHVVLFRFPVRYPQTKDGLPTARPCLVLEVDGEGASRKLVLAYGTTATSISHTGYDIRLTRLSDLKSAGLKRPTRFIGARLLSVSPNHDGFPIGMTGTPVTGRLADAPWERMQWVRARLHAEHGIAVEHQRERSSTSVAVEHRMRRTMKSGRQSAV
ncbi:hypothetical protein [Pseudooceanicola atlanticus]|uniref:hypothetical protein n=1 Tax=Pseudooceanicola atlanticus TaxID=1461694 RepID=UPI0012DFF0C0|nr:hypothetical protein [Pseudooceanicola atlanticus]